MQQKSGKLSKYFTNSLSILEIECWHLCNIWICIDQDLRHYIAWLGHNEFSPKADFRIVLVSLTGLLDRIRWVTAISWSGIPSLPSQFLKLNFSRSHPENLIRLFIPLSRLTCPGANFTGKVPKPKFYSPGVTGGPLMLHMPRKSSYVFLVVVQHVHVVPKLLYTAQRSWRGGILDSPCPSVCLSVRLSVDDMVSGA